MCFYATINKNVLKNYHPVKVLPNSITEIIKLQNSLVNIVSKNDARLSTPLSALLRVIFEQYPQHDSLNPLRDAIIAQITDGLGQSENGTEPIVDLKKTIVMLEATKNIPNILELISMSLVKAFHRLTKDHLGTYVGQGNVRTGADNDRQNSAVQKLILTVFDIIKPKIRNVVIFPFFITA